MSHIPAADGLTATSPLIPRRDSGHRLVKGSSTWPPHLHRPAIRRRKLGLSGCGLRGGRPDRPARPAAPPAGGARPHSPSGLPLFSLTFYHPWLAARVKRPRPSGLATTLPSAARLAETHRDTHQLARHSRLQRPFSAQHKQN